MAYINELGQTVGCSVSTSKQIDNFFSDWYVTLLPLAILIVIFFIFKKYVRNKFYLVVYTILAIILYAWWIPKTFVLCT